MAAILEEALLFVGIIRKPYILSKENLFTYIACMFKTGKMDPLFLGTLRTQR